MELFKKMSNLTSVSIPVSVLERARKAGINVSGTARAAVVAAVEKKERESRAAYHSKHPEALLPEA